MPLVSGDEDSPVCPLLTEAVRTLLPTLLNRSHAQRGGRKNGCGHVLRTRRGLGKETRSLLKRQTMIDDRLGEISAKPKLSLLHHLALKGRGFSRATKSLNRDGL